MDTADYKRKLVDYFKKNLTKGYTPGSLKVALLKQGYSQISIDEALAKATEEMAEKAPVLKTKPTIKYEIVDENDKPVNIKKSFWKRIFRKYF